MPTVSSRVIRFHEVGEPFDVLREERVEIPDPPPGRVRVKVVAVGLNPADWELCRGFAPGTLPRGIGFDVAGVVDAIGPEEAGAMDVTGATRAPVDGSVGVGDLVFGSADFMGQPSAGVADYAILTHWFRIPDGLEPIQAATLSMVVQSAGWTLELLDLEPGATLLVHGAGGMVGYAAVQMALRQGLRVIATAGPTFAPDLEGFGALVTAYGDGMPARVRTLNGGKDVDFVLDTSRPNPGILPDLIALASGDPRRVMTISNHAEARELGARVNIDEMRPDLTPQHVLLPQYASLAAQGAFRLPIARSYPLEQWREAVDLSLSGNPHGKVVLLPPS